MFKKIQLKQIGRKMFDPNKAIKVDQFDVWPGFSPNVVFNDSNPLLNIDIASKLISNTLVLDRLNQIRQRSGHQIEMALNTELEGRSVMTIYNRRFYRINQVVLNKTVNDSFQMADGRTITFKDYY